MQQRNWAALAAAMLSAASMPACAQDATAQTGTNAAASPESGSSIRYVEDGETPFGAGNVSNADAASVTMPKLAFTPDAATPDGYDKYYIFHRPDTDFATAYADIRECDGYARGLQSGREYYQVPYPYAGTLAGAAGGMIGNAIAAAIFGSAEKRRMRRVNMRTCMWFKGYSRYGLTKALWDEFNFEEGFSGVEDAKREPFLRQQALVASSAKPTSKELGQ